MVVPYYFAAADGKADLSIICRDGRVAAHKRVLAKALTTFQGVFFPDGEITPQGPDSIDLNGSVSAAHHFLCELYGHEIKVNLVFGYCVGIHLTVC